MALPAPPGLVRCLPRWYSAARSTPWPLVSCPAQQIRFCTSRDGVRIAYATCGSGPPLILVSHWARHLELDWDSPVWRPWLSMLARRHTLIRYDWRGCGLSDRERVNFSFERFGDDLAAVVQAAGVERFNLFGISDGGAVALAYAANHPDRVIHLVLYGSQSRGRLVRGTTVEQVEEANARLKLVDIGWPEENLAAGEIYTALHLPDASNEQVRSYNELLRRTTTRGNARALISALFHYDARKMVRQVRTPTLVLHGRGNAIIPFEEGRLIASLISGARFVPLESRNNIILDTEPAWRQLVDAIDNFLPKCGQDTIGKGDASFTDLTPREREVLELIAQGIDNPSIGKRLGIRVKTVRNQASIIFGKIGVHTRAQAIVRARAAGFGRSDGS